MGLIGHKNWKAPAPVREPRGYYLSNPFTSTGHHRLFACCRPGICLYAAHPRLPATAPKAIGSRQGRQALGEGRDLAEALNIDALRVGGAVSIWTQWSVFPDTAQRVRSR